MKLSETSLLSVNAPVHFHMCVFMCVCNKTERLCNRFVSMLIRVTITLPSRMKHLSYRWSRFINHEGAQIPDVRSPGQLNFVWWRLIFVGSQ